MTSPQPVSHLAFIRANVGSSAALGERLDRLLEPSRQAPGCLHFALQRSQCDDHLWLVSGFWTDEGAMTAYLGSPAMEVFSEVVQELMVSSLDLHTFADVSGERRAR